MWLAYYLGYPLIYLLVHKFDVISISVKNLFLKSTHYYLSVIFFSPEEMFVRFIFLRSCVCFHVEIGLLIECTFERHAKSNLHWAIENGALMHALPYHKFINYSRHLFVTWDKRNHILKAFFTQSPTKEIFGPFIPNFLMFIRCFWVIFKSYEASTK